MLVPSMTCLPSLPAEENCVMQVHLFNIRQHHFLLLHYGDNSIYIKCFLRIKCENTCNASFSSMLLCIHSITLIEQQLWDRSFLSVPRTTAISNTGKNPCLRGIFILLNKIKKKKSKWMNLTALWSLVGLELQREAQKWLESCSRSRGRKIQENAAAILKLRKARQSTKLFLSWPIKELRSQGNKGN